MPRAPPLCQPLGPSSCACRSWFGCGVELPPLSLLEKPRFATRGPPTRWGDPPPAAREVSTALALGSQPGHTFQGPFPLLPPPDALGVWWCLSGLRPNSVLNAGSSSFLTKSWVLLQDSIHRHSLSNMSVSQTGHRKPTEGKGGICTQASSIRGSEEQKPASASGSKILK